jgi:hypothetical protein
MVKALASQPISPIETSPPQFCIKQIHTYLTAQNMVFDIGQREGAQPKCYFTHATLPSHIDGAHPPTKKEPFRTVLDQPYSHTVCIIEPS